jgi:hypothetical protein
MSNPQEKANNIYSSILSRVKRLGDVIPSIEVQDNHRQLIQSLLEFTITSNNLNTTNLWEQLDFFYFFDGDSDTLKRINWANPSDFTAEFKNNNTSSANLNYKYISNYQPDLAKKWWDSNTVPEGTYASLEEGKTKYFAYKQVDSTFNGPIINKLIKEYITASFSSSITNTGSFPNDYYLIPTSSFTFIYYPNPNLEIYDYYVRQISRVEITRNGRAQYFFYSTDKDIQFKNSSSYIQNTGNDGGTFNSSATENTFLEIPSSQLITSSLFTGNLTNQNRYYPSIQVFVTTSYDSTSNEDKLIHIITVTTASFIPNSPGLYIEGPPALGENYSNNFTTFINLPENTRMNLQNYVNQSGYLDGTGVDFYDTYRTNLALNNGTYFDTNINLNKKVLAGTAKASNNDSFIGFFKGQYFGGGYDSIEYYNGLKITSSIRSGQGYTIAGVIESTSSNSSFALQIDNRYNTQSVALTDGYKAALGISLNNAPKNTNYGWSYQTPNSPSFPYRFNIYEDEDGNVNSSSMQNESGLYGNTGMYLTQRYSSSANQSTIRHYYNNKLITSSLVGSNTGSIPDGNILLGGIGSPSYVGVNYVKSSTIPTLDVYQADINSVVFTFDYVKIQYTSSLLVVSSSITSSLVEEVTSFDSIKSGSIDINNAVQGNVIRFLKNVYDDYGSINIPINTSIYLGIGDNKIGTVQNTNYIYTGNTEDRSWDWYLDLLITTSSVNLSTNSLLRSYFETVGGPSIDSFIPTTLTGRVFIANITGSSFITTSSFNIASSSQFVLNPSKTVSYFYNTNNTLPNTSLNLTSGSNINFTVSSSTLDLNTYFKTGSEIVKKGGNLHYSGSETGTFYITEASGTFVSTSTNYSINTLLFKTNNNTTLYNTEYILENGVLVGYPTSSTSGSNFNFKYTGSVEDVDAQLTLLSPGSKIFYQMGNPDYGDKYFNPDGSDLKNHNVGFMNPERFDCFFGGGGVEGLDLTPIFDIVRQAMITSNNLRRFGRSFPSRSFGSFTIGDRDKYIKML